MNVKMKVTFLELSLLSTKEKKAIKINLDHKKIIIYGENNTGKSAIIRHIYWTLGLDPINVFSKQWDHNITGLLKISIDNKLYYFHRNKDHRSLFRDEELVFSSDSNSEWNDYLSTLFDYPLELINKRNLKEYKVGLDGLLTPFFIEQDSGWNLNWNGPFKGLARFKDFYKETLTNFIGYKSIEAIKVKQKINFHNSELLQLNSELNIYNLSLKKLMIEKDYKQPRVDKNLFRKEIKESTNNLKYLFIQQNSLQQKLSTLIRKKLKFSSILESSIKSHNETIADINYLDEIDDTNGIECPTCGTVHFSSQEAKISLELDYEALEKNIEDLKTQISKINSEVTELNNQLAEIERNIEAFNSDLQSPKQNFVFQDIVDIEANKKISQSFQKNLKKINTDVKIVKNKIGGLETDLKDLDSTTKKKEIKEIFKNKINFHFNQLNIPYEINISQIHTRPNIGGGSSNPRAILALHMTYLEISYTKTSLPIFPFVIDTPQQNGQDMNNLSNSFTHLKKIDFTQLIIGTEILPSAESISGFKLITLENEYHLLKTEDYSNVTKEITSFQMLINERLEA